MPIFLTAVTLDHVDMIIYLYSLQANEYSVVSFLDYFFDFCCGLDGEETIVL